MNESRVERRTARLACGRELKTSLPAVGAAAAYSTKDWRLQFRESKFDPVVGAFAWMDRADGASSEGNNQNISIADIERYA